MKKTYVNFVADSGAATASLEPNDSRLSRLLTVDDVAARLQVKPRTVYHWVHERYLPAIKRGAQIRFDQASVATWIKMRETAGRISRRSGTDTR
jgi:excisionase family DNA binding protein